LTVRIDENGNGLVLVFNNRTGVFGPLCADYLTNTLVWLMTTTDTQPLNNLCLCFFPIL